MAAMASESAAADTTLAAYHRDEVTGCARCTLSAARHNVVVGSGPVGAELMLVGRAPSYEEDRRGAPFLAAVGDLLDRCLADIGLTRRRVFCTTLVKCRPPGGREPTRDEVSACEAHLHRQIQLVSPGVVVTLGSLATRVVSGLNESITTLHGRELFVSVAGRDVPVVPLYDPGAVLDSDVLRRAFETDFRAIGAIVGTAVTERPDEDGGAAEQLDLFG